MLNELLKQPYRATNNKNYEGKTNVSHDRYLFCVLSDHIVAVAGVVVAIAIAFCMCIAKRYKINTQCGCMRLCLACCVLLCYSICLHTAHTHAHICHMRGKTLGPVSTSDALCHALFIFFVHFFLIPSTLLVVSCSFFFFSFFGIIACFSPDFIEDTGTHWAYVYVNRKKQEKITLNMSNERAFIHVLAYFCLFIHMFSLCCWWWWCCCSLYFFDAFHLLRPK